MQKEQENIIEIVRGTRVVFTGSIFIAAVVTGARVVADAGGITTAAFGVSGRVGTVGCSASAPSLKFERLGRDAFSATAAAPRRPFVDAQQLLTHHYCSCALMQNYRARFQSLWSLTVLVTVFIIIIQRKLLIQFFDGVLP